MKGVLFKYSADPKDPLMKDKESSCTKKGCALRDPDFWQNPVKVWGICGPYIRASLNSGDIVFFLPQKPSWEKAGLEDYICTGIIVVDQKLPDKKAVLKEPKLIATYKRNWEIDLNIHLERDYREAPKTSIIRGKNFIIGDNDKSIWLGRNKNYLKDIFPSVGLDIYIEMLNQRRIKNIHGKKVELLYKVLTK